MLPSMYSRNGEGILTDRKRQIDTLKAFNDRVTVVREDYEYKIEFTSNGVLMCLGVQLPENFPDEKPILTIQPGIRHPWVTNDTLVTNAPGVLNFTVHSDLGRVTNAIIREWQTRPPQTIAPGTTTTTTTTPAPLSAEFPSLSNLPTSTLQSLNSSTDRLEEFVSMLPHWRSWDNAVKEKIAEIECIARDNLSKETDLTELKNQVADKVNGVEIAKAGCEEKVRELAKLSEVYEPENIRCTLQEAAHQSDLDAENIAERFLAGDIDVDHFLMDYVEIRKVSQIRKTKEEKLGKQLRELHRAGH